MKKLKIVPLRLRHQTRLAAGLLITPWLAAVYLCWSEYQLQPDITWGLLPGLAVAVYLQGQLLRHSETNHRRGEDDHLFATLGAANWITVLRAGAIVGLAGFLPWTLRRGQALPNGLDWAPGIIYLGISLADLFDGYVARRQERETELGKRLDIECDAAGLLVASLAAVAMGRLPAIYLLVGTAYYLFILGIRVRQKRALPVIPLQQRPYARIIAGFQMGLVAMALLPIFSPVFTTIAALIFMTPLLTGFFRDWLVVSGRMQTDTQQQSTLDLRVRLLMTRSLPLALRLVILAGGIAMLVGGDLYRAPLIWQLVHSFFCLLAGLGFMGRSAALFQTLMLGSNSSPFGVSEIPMIIFGAAGALMLTGTGAMSLWSPEEMILHRRRNSGPIAYGKRFHD